MELGLQLEVVLAVVVQLVAALAGVVASQPPSWLAQLKSRLLTSVEADVGAIWAGIAVAARADWAAWVTWG